MPKKKKKKKHQQQSQGQGGEVSVASAPVWRQLYETRQSNLLSLESIFGADFIREEVAGGGGAADADNNKNNKDNNNKDNNEDNNNSNKSNKDKDKDQELRPLAFSLILKASTDSEKNHVSVRMFVVMLPFSRVPSVSLHKQGGLSDDTFSTLQEQTQLELDKMCLGSESDGYVGEEEDVIFPLTGFVQDFLAQHNVKQASSVYAEMEERNKQAASEAAKLQRKARNKDQERERLARQQLQREIKEDQDKQLELYRKFKKIGVSEEEYLAPDVPSYKEVLQQTASIKNVKNTPQRKHAAPTSAADFPSLGPSPAPPAAAVTGLNYALVLNQPASVKASEQLLVPPKPSGQPPRSPSAAAKAAAAAAWPEPAAAAQHTQQTTRRKLHIPPRNIADNTQQAPQQQAQRSMLSPAARSPAGTPKATTPNKRRRRRKSEHMPRATPTTLRRTRSKSEVRVSGRQTMVRQESSSLAEDESSSEEETGDEEERHEQQHATTRSSSSSSNNNNNNKRDEQDERHETQTTRNNKRSPKARHNAQAQTAGPTQPADKTAADRRCSLRRSRTSSHSSTSSRRSSRRSRELSLHSDQQHADSDDERKQEDEEEEEEEEEQEEEADEKGVRKEVAGVLASLGGYAAPKLEDVMNMFEEKARMFDQLELSEEEDHDEDDHDEEEEEHEEQEEEDEEKDDDEEEELEELPGALLRHGSDASEASPTRSTQLHGERPHTFSRFASDFEVLRRIGHGGFGVVFEARNKLDQLVYAVKRIKLPRNPLQNHAVLREVSTIAMLHHSYIVRYFNAWLETGTGAHAATETGQSLEGWASDEAGDFVDPTQSTTLAGAVEGQPASSEPEQFLYIQMEFCAAKTLKEMIASGKVSAKEPKKVWRLFRQTLEAVAHLHEKGIIHRDLKPANVFIDAKENIKLGDFGLAVESSLGAAAAANSNDPTANPASAAASAAASSEQQDENDSGGITEVVGTPFYRSPEQEAEGVQYGRKADMWAMGVICYEMWQGKFGSEMERRLTLQALIETGRVPAGFMAGHEEREVVVSLVEQLLARNPKQRPDARKLLTSGLIPIKVEDEYVNVVLSKITKPSSKLRTAVVDTLFQAKLAERVDYTYDGAFSSTQPRTALPEQCKARIRERTTQKLVELFQQRGAYQFTAPLFLPDTAKVPKWRNSVLVLDTYGQRLQLPYSRTVPLVRHVAQQFVQAGKQDWDKIAVLGNNNSEQALSLDLRRYDMGPVYRKSNTSHKPKELVECVYDVFWRCGQREFCRFSAGAGSEQLPTSAPALGSQLSQAADSKKRKLDRAKEKAAAVAAEVLATVDSTIRLFSSALGRHCIRINHTAFFHAVLSAAIGPARHARHRAASSSSSGGGLVDSNSDEDAHSSLLRDLTAFFRDYRYDASSWAKTKEKLAKQVPALSNRAMDRLGQFFAPSGHSAHSALANGLGKDTGSSATKHRVDNSQTMLKLWNGLVKSKYANSRSIAEVVRAREELEACLQYARVLGVSCPIILDPKLVTRDQIYSGGVTFQVLCEPAMLASAGGSGQSVSASPNAPFWDVLAMGGRLDPLLQLFAPPAESCPDLHGFGAVLALEKIFERQYQQDLAALRRSGKSLRPGKLSKGREETGAGGGGGAVLLFCAKGHLLKERAAYAAKLWARSVEAIYTHPPMSLSEKIVKEYCLQLAVRWVAIFKKKSFKGAKQASSEKNSVVELVDLSHPNNQAISSIAKMEATVLPAEDLVVALVRHLNASGTRRGPVAATELEAGAVGQASAFAAGGSLAQFSVAYIDLSYGYADWMAARRITRLQDKALSRFKEVGLLAEGSESLALCVVDLPLTVLRPVVTAFYSADEKDALERVVAATSGPERGLVKALVSFIQKNREEKLGRRGQQQNKQLHVGIYSQKDNHIDVLHLQAR